MRKFIAPAIVVVIVIAWQTLIQFTFADALVTKLSSAGQAGALLANLLLSKKMVWALIVVAILLILQGIRENRQDANARKSPTTQDQSKDALTSREVDPPSQEGKPKPNIVCLGEDRLDSVRLDRHQAFRESDDYGPGAFRPVAAKFTNAPNPPERVASIDNVVAQVMFYSPDWPDREEYRVDHACWLNEESPYVSFGLDTVHHVVIGVFQHKKDGTSGFEPDFTIYGNNPDRSVPLSTYRDRFSKHFKIKVRLIVGEHGEFSSDHEFELQHVLGQGFSFGYISEKEKQLRNESTKGELKRFIDEGNKLFNTPLVNVDWDKLYSNIHDWSARVFKLISRHYGLEVSDRVSSSVATHRYPHKMVDGRSSFFDEYYSRFVALQDIAQEQGVVFKTTSVADVAKERSQRIVADLSTFSDEGDTLLQNALSGYDSGFRVRVLKWEDKVYTYLESHLGKNVAISFMRDDDLETYVVPDAARILQRDVVDKIHTRITRLRGLTKSY